MQRRWKIVLLIFLVFLTLCNVLALIPQIQERLGWHVAQWIGQLKTWLNPPEEVPFSAQAEVALDEQEPLLASSTPAATRMQAESTPTIMPTSLPLPASHNLEGVTYFSQHNRWNYCGPANLAMLLSYWNWEGTHDDVARVLKPFSRDKSVMPYEMEDYVREQTDLNALVRVGGNLEILKRLITNGFPVMVEKGTHFRDIHYRITWMGHYQVLSGYDDLKGVFIAQDSYIEPNYEQHYEELIEQWQNFDIK